MPSFCIRSRFSLILNSLDCSYWEISGVRAAEARPASISMASDEGSGIGGFSVISLASASRFLLLSASF